MVSNNPERVEKVGLTLRAARLRPVQIWVPDTRSPDFTEECRRQSLSLRAASDEAATLAWLCAAADTDGWK